MAKPQRKLRYVMRRTGSPNFQYIRNVPLRFRHLFDGKKQLWKSLDTEDIAVAAARSTVLEDEYQRVIEDGQLRISENRDGWLPHVYQTVVDSGGDWSAVESELRKVPVDDFYPVRPNIWHSDPSGTFPDRPYGRRDWLKQEQAKLESLKDGLHESRKTPDQGERKIRLAFFRLEIYRTERAIEALTDGEGAIQHSQQLQSDRRSLSSLIESYLKHYTKTENRKSLSIKRNRLALLEDALGGDRDVSSITSLDIANIAKEYLAFIPKTVGKNLKPLNQVARAQAAKSNGLDVINLRTMRLYLSEWNSFFNSAPVQDILPRNPCRHLKLKSENTASRDRNTFTSIQLQKLFRGPVFSGCDLNARCPWKTPGSDIVRKGQFWIPLISLYSGATLAEICDLSPDDIKKKDDVFIFEVRADKARNRSVKSDHRARCVPIHSKLIEAGLIGYAKEQTGISLFPELEKTKSRSTPFGKWFSRYVEWQLGDEHKGLSFHSFRHTFREAMRRPDVVEDHVLSIGGWTRGGQASDQYGNTPIQALKETIEKLSYDELQSLSLTKR